MMYTIIVTENGYPHELSLQNHVNHNIEDIPPLIQRAVAMLDAMVERPEKMSGIMPTYISAAPVGTKIYQVNGEAHYMVSENWLKQQEGYQP